MNKHKLPCINYLVCGSCPYNNKCTFIHDERLKINCSKVKSKERIILNDEDDAFYWPNCTNNCRNKNNNKMVLSMWSHLILTVSGKQSNPYCETNIYTNKKRLPFFINLGKPQ